MRGMWLGLLGGAEGAGVGSVASGSGCRALDGAGDPVVDNYAQELDFASAIRFINGCDHQEIGARELFFHMDACIEGVCADDALTADGDGDGIGCAGWRIAGNLEIDRSRARVGSSGVRGGSAGSAAIVTSASAHDR